VNRTVVILIIAALCLAPALRAQSQKIGFVNSAKIFQELPAAQEAEKRIDAVGKPYRDTLEAMQTELQGRYEEYQKKEGLMTDAAKKTEQQKLVDLQNKMQQYRVDKFGTDGELAKRTEQILNPIREKIKAAISAVAKELKYGFVFDKTEQIQILLYGDAAFDLTYKVIDRLRSAGK
jgi:outer membrane protein